MKQLSSLLISIFTFSLLVGQKVDKRTSIAVNNSINQSAKVNYCNEKIKSTVMAIKNDKTSGVRVKTLDVMLDDESVPKETTKSVVENECEKILADVNQPVEANDVDNSFADPNDQKVQAALNWFKNKKGLK